MATITSYDTKAGRRWRVRYRKPDRSQTDKRGFATKRDAQAFAATVETSKLRGDYIDPTAGRITVAELGEPRLARRQPVIKPSTWYSEESTWRVHVKPVWGDYPIGEVTYTAVQDWVAGLSKQRSATTVLRAYSILSGILRDAVRDGRLPANPVEAMQLPRKKPAPRRYLTIRQVETLANASQGRATLVTTLAYTGLRWGELAGLRVRHVDFLRRRIRVEENAVSVAHRIVVGTPKSHANRSVPFPAFLAEDLAALCEGKGRDALLFGDGRAHINSTLR